MMSESLSKEAMKGYTDSKQENRGMKEWSEIQSRNDLKDNLCGLLLRSGTQRDKWDDWLSQTKHESVALLSTDSIMSE